MPVKEIARELQGKAANLALRMPIAWVNILAGPPITVDGRTLDGRAQWFLQLLARSGRVPVEMKSVAEARAELDAFLPLLAGKPLPVGEIVDRTIEGPAGRLRIRIYRPAGSVARLLPTILYFHGGGWTIGSLEAYDLPCRFFCGRVPAAPSSPSTIAWRPSTNSRPPSTMPSPPIAGWRPRRSASASTRRASCSPAMRPAATSPPSPPACCARRRGRPACNG